MNMDNNEDREIERKKRKFDKLNVRIDKVTQRKKFNAQPQIDVKK